MIASCRLSDVSDYHPRLLWDDAIAAAVSVAQRFASAPIVRYAIDTEGLAAVRDNQLLLDLDLRPFSAARIARLERTYEPARIVELAAIAIAGVALYHGGRHEIVDVTMRGSGADYRVDHSGVVLEVTGRTRRRDVNAAWESKRQRLLHRSACGAYICVVEFETPGGRLTFTA